MSTEDNGTGAAGFVNESYGIEWVTGVRTSVGTPLYLHPVTPGGQQSVPLEPTDEMAKAGYEAMWNEKLHEEKIFCSAIAAYKAMLAAAPK